MMSVPESFDPPNRSELNPADREKVMARLRQDLWEISNWTTQEFRREDIAPHNFVIFVPLVDRVLSFVHYMVASSDLDLLPDRDLVDLSRTIESLKQRFLAIKNFAPRATSADPVLLRDRLVQQLRTEHEAAFRRFAPLLAGISRASTRGERLKDEVLSTRSEVEKLLSEAKTLARGVRDVAQMSGVAAHAGIFGAAAMDHHTSAKLWLRASIFMAIGAFGAAILSLMSLFAFTSHYAALPLPLLVHLAVGKLIVFSLLFSAVLWCAKMYSAHRHNYIVNRHRQFALTSFETFVTSTTDPLIRNAILLQSTQCIFTPQSTGYFGEDQNSVQAAPQVLEIVRNLVESKTGA